MVTETTSSADTVAELTVRTIDVKRSYRMGSETVEAAQRREHFHHPGRNISRSWALRDRGKARSST